WMLYLALVSTLLALAAWAAEAVLRSRGLPGRWPWAAAMLGTVLVPLVAARLPSLGTLLPRAGTATGMPLEGTPLSLTGMQATSPPTLPAYHPSLWLEPALGALWLAAGLLLAVAFASVYLRLVRRGRAWPAAEMEGMRVRLSDGFGPAVLGLLRPAVIIPSRLAATGGTSLRLALAHEAEHVRARDPLLLAAGAAYVAALPFSPAAWWALRRLRAAVELDCDARVLRGGADRRAYAELLIRTTAGEDDLPLAVPALLHPRSTLETRIRAMTTPRTAAPLRSALAACAAAALLLAACEARSPVNLGPTPEPASAVTDAGIAETGDAVTDGVREDRGPEGPVTDALTGDTRQDRVLVESVELGDQPDVTLVRKGTTMTLGHAQLVLRQAQDLTSQEPEPMIIVDGVIMARPLRVDLEALDITSVEIIKGDAARSLYGSRASAGVINITTGASPERFEDRPVLRPRPPVGEPVTTERQPMIIVDGVIVSGDTNLEALDIADVEIVKGAAARALYGTRAAAGVIVVTTKR
ncbi:MAG: M56 family metallopeptidase, partial [Gemmatimonadota bacterium]